MENKERKATWLELFFDLVFVAVVAQLSHSLAEDVSAKGCPEILPLVRPRMVGLDWIDVLQRSIRDG